MQLPYSEELHIESLGRLFDNTSECYKFFWFKAIVNKVADGRIELTYEELIDEMIADAWYMVTEYHLNLGPKDTLESLVDYMKQNYPMLKSSDKKTTILDFLKSTSDKNIISRKRVLILNVPYRLQAPFMQLDSKEWSLPKNQLVERINSEKHLMYYFILVNGLQTRIGIREEWTRYLVKNQEIIRGWLEYNMILYLQKRNPSVPGIADKLNPMQERSLDRVKKYWKLIMALEPVYEIYSSKLLIEKDLSIDHFVPWSYVANDELWNLCPTTRSINSSKSNNLPEWDTYYPKLAEQEYQSYCMIWKYDAVHREFEKCAREHINNGDIRYRVYRRGLNYDEFSQGLESVILPVYQSAENCGFKRWEYDKRL